MRLDVSVVGAENLFRAVNRRLLNDIGKLTAAVITLARITFGILVGKNRTGGFENGFRDEIFRRDKF